MTRQCDLCAEIDPDLNHVENARLIGVSESTIRRHRAHMAEAKSVQPLTVERMSVRDPITGTWTKYKAVDKKDALDEVYKVVEAAKLLNRLERFEPTQHGWVIVFDISSLGTCLYHICSH